ncbi:caspase family protein [Streptomyces purpureus]|uniref:caspase, EACC1-associated type n=1 Tax=Streptomyces purpureus TaxID=1951 RepID=UPI0037B1E4CF
MTGGLAEDGARAVIVGTGAHAPGSALPGLPSVDTTLDDLQRLLRDVCGMADDRIHRVPATARPDEIVAAVERAVDEATGVVLFLYAGHGLLGPGDELYFATRTSRSAEQIADAVPYHTLKGLLGRAAEGSVVVLDCCFSGRAGAPTGARAADPFVSARPTGSFLLSSAAYFALSYAPEGERHTLFGGGLVELLESGDPTGPPHLTLDHLHAALDRKFRGGLIQPQRQSEGTLGALAVAPNAAYRPPPPAGPDGAPPADVPCPYPGMEAFRAEDSGYFHGRDALTDRLVTALTDTDVPHPLVLVGASGVGKSSLLRAGLLARLERAPEPWPTLLLSAPGPRPLRALAELWARATGRDPDDVRAALDDGRLAPPLPGRTACRLLVVDQFEEVFTRCGDAEERARFIAVLTAGAPGHPKVVLSLRADHYGSCLDHPALAGALEHHQLTVLPMTEDDLRTAVEQPASAAGLTLQTGLVDRLLHDLRQGGPAGLAGLPFLAHVLRETWLRRSGATLTLAGYQATGGIWQSVTTTTEKLYQSLDQRGRTALRELLLRMVHVGADASEDAVRRRIPTAELLSAGRAILDRLVESRLVTLDQSSAQISHEALLRAWPRLHRWIDENRAELVLRQQLADDADEWNSAHRHPGYLYRGPRLATAASLLRRNRLTRPLDIDFVERGLAEEAAERRREAHSTRRLKRALGGVALALCVALIAAFIAYGEQNETEEQRRIAEQQSVVATYRALKAEAETLRPTQPQTALRLAIAAYRIQPSAESRTALFDGLAQGHFAGRVTVEDRSWDVRVLGGGGRLLALDRLREGRRLELWDVGTPGRPGRRLAAFDACPDDVKAADFSPDARTLAVACKDGTVSLWSLRTPATPRRTTVMRAPGLPKHANAIRFGPDGRTLGGVGWWQDNDRYGALVLWDVRDQARPRQLGVRRGVYESKELHFSPDGRTLFTASGAILYVKDWHDKDSIAHHSGAKLWDITDPARPKELSTFPVREEAAAFTPDGRILATAGGGTVELWDLSTPAKPRRMHHWLAHKENVTALAFRPDGTTLATGSLDKSVVLWNVTDPKKPAKVTTLVEHDGLVDTMAFASDGRRLVSAADEEVIHWRAGGDGRPRAVASFDGMRGYDTFDLSPDGTLLAGGGDEVVDLWDVRDLLRPKRLASLTGHTSTVRGVAFSGDGKSLVSGDRGGKIVFWDLARPTRPRATATVRRDKPVEQLAFSPRGDRLVSVEGDLPSPSGQGTVWDTTDRRRPRALLTLADLVLVEAPRFRPDGKLLAFQVWTAKPLGVRTLLWDMTPGGKRVEVRGAGPFAFSADGQTFANLYLGDDLELWEVTDPLRPRALGRAAKRGRGQKLQELAFHPGGNLVAGATREGSVVLWAVGDRGLPHQVANLTEARAGVDSVRFTPDGRRLLATDGRSVLVWDLDDFPEIAADTLGRACAVAGRGLADTYDEWKRYASALKYRKTCP